MRGPSLGTLLPYATLAVLVLSLALLNHSGSLVRIHMDSGTNWILWGYEVNEVSLNSSVPQVNRTITSVRLDITHFNVSTGNASILVLSWDGAVLLNETEVSGSFIAGVTTPFVDNSSSAPVEEYILCLYWTATNTTVSYEYGTYGLISWDGVPYTVLLPGFDESYAAAMSLFIGSMIMFVITLPVQFRSSNRVALHSKYALLVLASLVPSLLRLRVYDSIVSYSILSSAWSYVLNAGPWMVSRVTLAVNAEPEAAVILCSTVNMVLLLIVLMAIHRVVNHRMAVIAVYVSFVPYVSVLLIDLWSATTPYTPDVYYLPVPLLQLAALFVMRFLASPLSSRSEIQ